MDTMTVSINPNNFQRGLKTVKGWGFKFDANSKTWSGRVPMALQSPVVDVPAYLRNSGLKLVTPTADVATNWNGATSMDAEESIF